MPQRHVGQAPEALAGLAPTKLPLRTHSGQSWQWTHHEQMMAEGRVPRELWWPIPVECRDADLQHQSVTKLMDPSEILDFLKRDLHGEQWIEADLDVALANIYNQGGGHL